jgi:fluoroacetyl-CoA thioesterase
MAPDELSAPPFLSLRFWVRLGLVFSPEEGQMKASLRAGLSKVNRIPIGRERTIGFMGEEARTYGTPAMILDIEHTCRELILEHADAGEDSVGMEVSVKHLAPTLMGMTVEITVRVVAVDRRKVQFEASVKDELDEVGAGTHTRFVIEKAKTFERLKAKAARFAARTG